MFSKDTDPPETPDHVSGCTVRSPWRRCTCAIITTLASPLKCVHGKYHQHRHRRHRSDEEVPHGGDSTSLANMTAVCIRDATLGRTMQGANVVEN